MQDYEKLGAFYLGGPYDPFGGRAEDGLVLYDSKDLVTHAVRFGTGSGKTRPPAGGTVEERARGVGAGPGPPRAAARPVMPPEVAQYFVPARCQPRR